MGKAVGFHISSRLNGSDLKSENQAYHICDFDAFYKLMEDKKVDGIIHLAAESHVDRSIKDPFTFAKTNVMGTLSLLQAAKLYWESLPEKYVMVSPSNGKTLKRKGRKNPL